jgi:hypothetical protein
LKGKLDEDGYFLLRFVRLNIAPNRMINAVYMDVCNCKTGVCLVREIEYPPTGTEETTIFAVPDVTVLLLASVTFKYT